MTMGRQGINRVHRALMVEKPGEVHPALRLAHGLDEWPSSTDPKKKQDLIQAIVDLRVPDFYRQALSRWKAYTGDRSRFYSFEMRLVHRLYVGLSRDNPVETGVTIAHTYGMPILPGSSLKGLARASAEYVAHGSGGLSPEALRWMFGEGGDQGEVGGLIFHDAWWCGPPDRPPFVLEVVTPHHTEYYRGSGDVAASDTDSPVPNTQIAVQGSFLFTVEGDPGWTTVAAHLLTMGLQQWGIGGKKSSGYGLFEI